MQQLRQEVPATAEVLAPKQIGFALRWKLTMEGQLVALRHLAQDPDVQAFLAHHRELEADRLFLEQPDVPGESI